MPVAGTCWKYLKVNCIAAWSMLVATWKLCLSGDCYGLFGQKSETAPRQLVAGLWSWKGEGRKIDWILEFVDWLYFFHSFFYFASHCISPEHYILQHDCCLFVFFLSISSLTPLAMYLEMISLHYLWPVFFASFVSFASLHSLIFILRTYSMRSFWAERLSSTLYLLSAFTTTSVTSAYKK